MAEAPQRRNYFTKKGFQTRFILHFAAASVLANAFSVALFIVLAKNRVDSLLYSMRLPQFGAGALLFPAAFTASVAAVVGVALLFLAAARELYHRTTGPLHRIRTDLQKIGSGDLSLRVVLREEEEFKCLAGEINAMVEALNSRFSGIKGRVDELDKMARALGTSPTPEQSRTLRNGLKQAIRSLEEHIRAFRL